MACERLGSHNAKQRGAHLGEREKCGAVAEHALAIAGAGAQDRGASDGGAGQEIVEGLHHNHAAKPGGGGSRQKPA